MGPVLVHVCMPGGCTRLHAVLCPNHLTPAQAHSVCVPCSQCAGTLDVDHVSLLPLDAGMAGDPARVAQVLDQQSHTSRLLTGEWLQKGQVQIPM
jgi:hypothetical protein